MKKLILLVSMCAAISFASCSDDDNNPSDGTFNGEINPSTVLTAGIPKQVGEYTLVKDSEGRVTEMTSSYGSAIKFNYTPVELNTQSRAVKQFDMTMDDGDYIYYIQLNGFGFIKYAYQVPKTLSREPSSEIEEPDEWWFTYNGDGTMASMTRSEGGNEHTTLKYSGGDVVGVSMSDEDGFKYSAVISYTDANHSAPIDNKGSVMFYDATLDIDMDEMYVAYYAGILGKATKHLPLSCTETDKYGTDTETFQWTLNANGIATSMRNDNGEVYEIKW